MPLNASPRLALVVACACTVWGCGDGRPPLSPTSPSSLSSQTSPRARGTELNGAPRRIDSDGDGYEDGDGGVDFPVFYPDGGPLPDPGSVPNPDELPPPDGVVMPVQLTINIVGTFGAAAFSP